MRFTDLPVQLRKQVLNIQTPFFLFDMDTIQSKVRMLEETLKPDKIFYAVKCNSLQGVLSTIAQTNASFEANNRAEIEKVIVAGGKPTEVINSSPVCSAIDVRILYEKGVRDFTFDSRSQMENIAQNAPGSRVFLRLYTTNEGSRFDLSKRLGMQPDEALSLLEQAAGKGLIPHGLTFHVGSQCVSPSNWRQGLQVCGEIFRMYPGLQVVNLGGGLPIDYKESNVTLDDIAFTINKAVDMNFKERPKLYVEPGRFIVGDSAIAVSSVTQVDHKPGISRAVLDISVFTGLIEILEIGDHFSYPLQTDSVKRPRLYRLGGPTCAGTDIIAEEASLPELHADYINPLRSSRVFLCNAGAYTLDYVNGHARNGFNGALIPKYYFMKDGEIVHDV